MSNPIPLSEVPEDLGRNDPCPCESGRKYKKCCQRAHRLAEKSEKKSRQAHQVIGSATKPWKVLKALQQVKSDSALGLFFNIIHDQSPLRERYGSRTALIQAVDRGDFTLPADSQLRFAHMRLDAPDTYLLLRDSSRKDDQAGFQVITLRRNEVDGDGQPRDVEHEGFRVWDVQNHQVDRNAFDDLPTMEQLGIHWHPGDN